MKTSNLIGHKIKDILVWSKMEVGGLDEAEVFIKLDNGKTIHIPWDFDSENIETELAKDSISLFADISDYPIYSVNPKGKTITEIQEAKKERETSILGRIKNILGIKESIPKEYKVYKTEYIENKIKYIQNQRIVNYIKFDESDIRGFIELENGFLISETSIAPHGTGLAGLNYYESLNELQLRFGKDYRKLV